MFPEGEKSHLEMSIFWQSLLQAVLHTNLE